MEPQVHQEQTELRELMEPQVHQGQTERLVQMELQVQTELQVQMELQEVVDQVVVQDLEQLTIIPTILFLPQQERQVLSTERQT